jgi:TadE-like protein
MKILAHLSINLPVLQLYRLCREGRAAVAVEVALILPLYLAVVFSMFEVGFMAARILAVDSAATEVARQVYTGAATRGDVDIDDLYTVVCDRADFFISDCEDNLTIELVKISAIDSVPSNDAVCIESPDEIAPVVEFKPGARNEVMFLRICVTARKVLPVLANAVRLGESDGKIRIVSSISFMNEPFR